MSALTPCVCCGSAATGPAASTAGAAGAASVGDVGGIQPKVINMYGGGLGPAISSSVFGERFTMTPGSGRQ